LENQSFEAATPIDAVTPTKPKGKSALLPILIVLFVISYGLMCTLVVEQGSTIDAQRFLIRQLLGDSTQLSAMKSRILQKKQSEAKAQPAAPAQPDTQSSPGNPPQAQAPSAQAAPAPNSKTKNNRTGKVRPVPQKPPQDASEMADERRNLISI
jgi:predicted lipid-binding transport protein (Tim44 family)